MAEAAKANNVPFVDLFAASQKLYDATEPPLTINGVHLNELGNKLVADAIDSALAGGNTRADRDEAKVDAIRKAVVDKAWHWFRRYRKTDGFNVYGDRAFLQFKPDNQSNYEPLQRELEQLDVMTANRDAAVRAVAQGKPAAGPGRRLEHPAGPRGQDEQARPRAGRVARVQDRRGGDGRHEGRADAQGPTVRRRAAVPGAGQPGADVVRHEGPAVGRDRGRATRTGPRRRR
jgi:hypothetical protein